MAEESDLEKTEQPSARRLEKAREEGQVPRSREWATFALLAAAMGGLWLSADLLQSRLGSALHQGLGFGRAAAFDSTQMLAGAQAMGLQGLLAVAPFLVLMLLVAVAAPLALGGLVFSPQAFAPKFSKLNPLAGLARMVSMQSLADLVKAIAKSVAIGVVAYLVIRDGLGAMSASLGEHAQTAIPHMVGLVARSCVWMIGVLLLVAAIDVPYQVWALHRKLRMSREDVRQEHKESEGDPHVKGRIKRQQQALARRRMMSEVPKADLVLTNPTHFSVALRYEEGAMGAPRLVAKGTGLVAQRIREIAAEHRVEVVESPALARSLYKHTALGQEIPGGLYAAVAEVLAWVYQLRRWRAQGGEAPPRAPADPDIPQDLRYDGGGRRMNALATLLKLSPGSLDARRLQGLAGPILVVLILAMMVLPLPPFLLDMLFTFNIAMAVMVLLVSMYTMKPLDFAAFPAVLLFSTLLRLSLNVASTRVVLMNGHTGAEAAGKVIEAFGHFLVGGNFAVGVMVFIILVLINFMVITKGAGRIAEVGARFTLDAMPGKQMAIDADLNAGLIGEDVARKRRAEVSQEADFYGSMDGASKFVRGDAIAGLLIMAINIVGGLVVGMAQHGLDFSTAATTYTLLAIGDGLVAQIPALVISTAAGVMVSRVTTEEDVGRQLTGQLFSNPQVMFLTAAIIGLLGVIPGMPHLAFLVIAGALAWFGRRVGQRRADAGPAAEAEAAAQQAAAAEPADASWDDVSLVDPLGIEVGYRLIPLVDVAQQGELLGRIKGIRKKIAQEVGFLVPVVHIRDNLEIKPNAYVISLKGVPVAQGEAFPNRWLAINPGHVSAMLAGEPTKDPAFGLPAVWIDAAQRQQAQMHGYTVVDACTVIATHMNYVITSHTAELLGRQEVQELVDQVAKQAPKLVEDLVPKVIGISALQKVLQNLLQEEVPIRDMRTILEVMADHAPTVKDPAELTSLTRLALGRAITQQVFPGDTELQVVSLDPELDRVLAHALASGGGIEPGLAHRLLQDAQAAMERQEQAGLPPVLVVQHPLRVLLSRFLRRSLPRLKVLSNAEIPDARTLRIVATLGAGS